jgi:hypothetical protein
MSLNKLSISAIKKMPVVLGEVDVIKSLLLLGNKCRRRSFWLQRSLVVLIKI